MGQYYKVYAKDAEGNEKAFCPHSAVFMAAHGLKHESEIENHPKRNSWDWDDGESWGSLFNGLKLMEHSWFENKFVSGVLEAIEDNPCAIAWVGDYAADEGDFGDEYTERVYNMLWGDESAPEAPFDKMPGKHADGYIINRSKGVYIGLDGYAKAASFIPYWDKDGEWCIHPLPILTAIGNGRGGGDYHGTCMDMVGTWAMDVIEYTHDVSKLRMLQRMDVHRIAFREE